MNIKKNSLKNLKPNKSHWNNSETCVIRVPKILREDILKYAKQIDSKNNTVNRNNSTVTIDTLRDITLKIKAKEKGYKSNSASQLIKDLLVLIDSQE